MATSSTLRPSRSHRLAYRRPYGFGDSEGFRKTGAETKCIHFLSGHWSGEGLALLGWLLEHAQNFRPAGGQSSVLRSHPPALPGCSPDAIMSQTLASPHMSLNGSEAHRNPQPQWKRSADGVSGYGQGSTSLLTESQRSGRNRTLTNDSQEKKSAK